MAHTEIAAMTMTATTTATISIVRRFGFAAAEGISNVGP